MGAETNVITQPEHARALSRRELDQMKCPHGCDEHPQRISMLCHRGRPPILSYDKQLGALQLRCSECGARGPSIAVAEEAPTDA